MERYRPLHNSSFEINRSVLPHADASAPEGEALEKLREEIANTKKIKVIKKRKSRRNLRKS